MKNEQQPLTVKNDRKEQNSGKSKIILGLVIGILLTLCLGVIIWSVISGKLFVRVNRADPVSTARAIAVAFLDKNHEEFMKLVPLTDNIAFEPGWWENAEYIKGMLGCNAKWNELELFRSRWLQGPIENYKIVEVLIGSTDYPNYKSADVVINYDGNQHVLKFWMENLSNKWWAIPFFGLCFE